MDDERAFPEYPLCDLCERHDSHLVEGVCDWCRKQHGVRLSEDYQSENP